MQAIFTKDIDAFLKSNHVLSVATVANGSPWAANAFYAFDENRGRLVYFSRRETRHSKAASDNAEVAATIAPQSPDVDTYSGLQISGFTLCLDGSDLDEAKALFSGAFPDMDTEALTLWSLVPDYIKMVDHKDGSGHEIIWPHPQESG